MDNNNHIISYSDKNIPTYIPLTNNAVKKFNSKFKRNYSFYNRKQKLNV